MKIHFLAVSHSNPTQNKVDPPHFEFLLKKVDLMAIKNIRKAAVIGGGVMGRGIAAQLANAGIPSVLLDIIPPKPGENDDVNDPVFRNRFAVSAVEKFKKDRPALIYSKLDIEKITPGNTSDHMEWLADVDWIVEAVPEVMSIKQATFAAIEKHAHPNAIICSNTSGLSIEAMLEGRSDAFKKRFAVTHFFNPVRYMKLLEIVPAKDTDPEILDALVEFGRDVLGKGIVFGKDTTNFIANRIGVHGMMTTMHLMGKYELGVEAVDAIFAKPMGRPKSAVFRTADVVGLDTFVHVSQNCYDTLLDDEEREIFKIPEIMTKLVEKGWTGSKAKQGFYKKEGREIKVLNLNTLEYEPKTNPKFSSLSGRGKPGARIKSVLTGDDKAAKFALEVSLRSMAYSARRLGEIADDIVNIDRGMRWGFNWDLGPFETWDAVGVKWGYDKMKEAGIDVPAWVGEMVEKGNTSFYKWEGDKYFYYDYREHTYVELAADPKEINFTILKQGNSKVQGNDGTTLHDIGDGVALLEVHTKMNSIGPDVMQGMHDAIDEVEKNFDGLVIANGSDNFSVGANLMLVMMAVWETDDGEKWTIKDGSLDEVDKMLKTFQDANQRMRYSPKPVVSVPTGMTFGGGAELAMGANAIQAAGELYMGLVEVGVGLIPAGGGCLQVMRNHFGLQATNRDMDPMKILQGIFMTLGMAKVATSAEEAKEFGFLSSMDGISLNRAHAAYYAKQRVIGMVKSGWRPPREMKFRLPGESAISTIDMLLYSMVENNQVSEYDRTVGTALARVLCGGNTTTNVLTTEQQILDLERESFLDLLAKDKTRERMQYMLMNNKPLRN